MSSESFGLFKSPQNSQISRNGLRWIEWFIAIIFVLTLLIGSGVFIEASNAADIRLKNSSSLVLDPHAMVPGTMRSHHAMDEQTQLPSLGMSSAEDDNSCELKP